MAQPVTPLEKPWVIFQVVLFNMASANVGTAVAASIAQFFVGADAYNNRIARYTGALNVAAIPLLIMTGSCLLNGWRLNAPWRPALLTAIFSVMTVVFSALFVGSMSEPQFYGALCSDFGLGFTTTMGLGGLIAAGFASDYLVRSVTGELDRAPVAQPLLRN